MKIQLPTLLLLALLAGLPHPTPAATPETRTTALSSMQKYQKAVVSIKLVIKMKFSKQEQESKSEITGTVVDPSGLTLVSASNVDPATTLASIMAPYMKGRNADQFKMESDVAETMIILDDGTEVEADVVLKDQDLDMAFIRPRDTSRKFDHIPLKARSTPPQLLEDVFILGRMSPSDNRAASIAIGMIEAVVKGPRTYYVCDANLSQSGIACVAFDKDGATLGAFVLRKPKAGGNDMGMMGAMMGGNSSAMPMPVLRPVEDILDLIPQAKAVKVPEKKVAPAEKPSEPEQPKKEKSTPPAPEAE